MYKKKQLNSWALVSIQFEQLDFDPIAPAQKNR